MKKIFTTINKKMENTTNKTKDLENLTKIVQKYYKGLDQYPAVTNPENGFLRKEMPKMFSEDTKESKELFNEYFSKWIPYTTHWQSPYYFSFFPSNSLPSTILGEMAMGGLNEGNNISSKITDRKNAQVEDKVMNWITDLLQLPECFVPKNGAHAVMYNTAGQAFINVAFAAKNKKILEHGSKSIIDKQVGYMPIVSNTAVERSIKFSNLIVRYVKNSSTTNVVDEFPLTAEHIEKVFEEDIAKGLVPTYFNTNLGSTQSLSIEDISEVAKACQKYGVWLHIDSAQLGIYAAVPEYRYILKDIELADSFSTNGHKSMGCGMGTSFFWTKHSEYPKWITHFSNPTEDGDEYSLNDRSNFHVTLPNNNRSLRTMFHLLSLGKKGITELFRKHFDLANYFRDLMNKDKRFELLETKNKFPLVLFRLKDLDNDQNNAYLDYIMEPNKIFLVPSMVHDIAFLRINIGTFTHEEKHIKETFEYIQKWATEYLQKLD